MLEEELGENKSALTTDTIPTLSSNCIDMTQEISVQKMPLALELRAVCRVQVYGKVLCVFTHFHSFTDSETFK